MSGLELFLDEGADAPLNETWGVVCRDGRPSRLFLERSTDPAGYRLGAVSRGRVTARLAGGDGAFVDLGCGEPFGFLPGARHAPEVGEGLEVAVAAEPRGGKGPVLKRLGTSQGKPQLLRPALSVAETLARLYPETTPVRGAAAIEAVWQARETALETTLADKGVDVAIERTRGLVAVDVDFTGVPGRDAARARLEANRRAIRMAAERIALKRWAGPVVLDLIGGGQQAEPLRAEARAAFAGPGLVVGPLSRLGLLQLALPWRWTPVEEWLFGARGDRAVQTARLDGLRRLRQALDNDRSRPWLVLAAAPVDGAALRQAVQALGPRARLVADDRLAAGQFEIRETES